VAFSPVAPPLHAHVTSLWAPRARALWRAGERRARHRHRASALTRLRPSSSPPPPHRDPAARTMAASSGWCTDGDTLELTSGLLRRRPHRWSDRGERIRGLFSITDGRRVHLRSHWRPGMRENMHKCLWLKEIISTLCSKELGVKK